MDENTNEEPRIVQTDVGAKDGQDKCPKCGATDISLNTKTGMLRCNYCRHEFAPQKVQGMETDISHLHGEVMGSGTQDIQQDTKDIITLKCSSCGAEVVIDTSESTQARCHWCRNTLSLNQQIPNGSIPDVVLPFKLSKNEAKQCIEDFVGNRKFFAHPKFKEEFTTDNIMGVYFPYMVVDVNSHVTLHGQGEHEVSSYTRKVGDEIRTYYDADLYEVGRDFDLTINGLTVESNADKLDTKSSDKTNNVINAIMPFDVENCVKWNSNYLKGFTSERRDTNVAQLRDLVTNESKDIARFSANDTIKQYDRGVCWDRENFEVKGQQWKSAYLPVWLYSYRQVVDDSHSVLHYVAVNARTKETMGSVPIHMPKLFGVSALVELLGLIMMLITNAMDFSYSFIFLLIGFIYFAIMYMKYRNNDARHYYETETKTSLSNLRQGDRLIRRKTGLTNSTMDGANNKKLSGQNGIRDALNTVNNVLNKF